MENNGQVLMSTPAQALKALVNEIGAEAVGAMVNPPQPPPGQAMVADYPELTPEQEADIKDKATGRLRNMLNFRRLFDQKRLSFYRQYIGTRDQALFPDNVTKRSNTFVPYPFSNVETIVSRAMDAFFSFWPWFDVRGRGQNDDPAAEMMGLVLDQKLKQANFVKFFEDLVRNIAIYGHAAIKVGWDWDYDTVQSAEPEFALDELGQPVLNPVTGEPIVLRYNPIRVDVPRARPTFEAIDIYDLLVDPDGAFVAHMIEKPIGQMLREAQMNPKLYYAAGLQDIVSRVSKEKDWENILIRMAELWDNVNGTCTLITFGDDKDAIAFKDARMSQRAGQSYSAYRRKVYGGAPIILWHGENPYMHKKAPILFTSYVKLPNEVYGLGSIEVITDLSEGLNRMVNMVVDNWNLGINKRYAYDTQADIDHEALNAANVPGGKVAVTGDPSKVLFPLPFFTPNQGDYAVLDLYKGMIEMTSGISDFYSKAVGGPQGNSTATGIQSVINESNFRFKMFIRNLELDVLQPLLYMCSSMIQQYVTDEQEVEITDAPPGIQKFYRISPAQLLGNMDFDIVASNYASNKVVRQRNLLAFANLAAQSNYLMERPALEEMGKIFEIRNIRSMLKTDEQLQQEAMGAMQAEKEMKAYDAQIEAALMILQARLNAMVNASKPAPTGGGSSGGGSSVKRPSRQGQGGGRPRGAQSEGKIPGSGITSAVREFSQNMGLTALGLGGLGETSDGGG
jgi:hypothetical protein